MFENAQRNAPSPKHTDGEEDRVARDPLNLAARVRCRHKVDNQLAVGVAALLDLGGNAPAIVSGEVCISVRARQQKKHASHQYKV